MSKELQEIIETFPNYEEADISYTETSHGTKVLIVKGSDAQMNYVEPISRGLSYLMSMPVFTPGPTVMGSMPK